MRFKQASQTYQSGHVWRLDALDAHRTLVTPTVVDPKTNLDPEPQQVSEDYSSHSDFPHMSFLYGENLSTQVH